MQAVYLFKGLELAPAAVRRVIGQVPRSNYDQRLDPERFSLREALCHLADWEPINLDRLRQGVENPGCTVEGFDEGRMAIERNYARQDVEAQVARFEQGRIALMNYLRSIPEDRWENVYFHSERGRQTVYEQAVTILGHDLYHLEQFTQYMPELPAD